MNTTVLILVILTVIYVPLWFYVWKHPNLLSKGLEKYGPVIKINSRFGIRFIDRFSKYHRFWSAFGTFSQIVSLFLMVMMVYIMVFAVLRIPSMMSRGGVGIEYVLAIPGLNPLLPFWYGLAGLIIALVCHEMAHGLQSKSNGVDVKHTGLLYGVLPLGAFVEPDEEQVQAASRRTKLHLYTAGITTNFVIAAIAFLLFSTVLLGGVNSPYDDKCAVYSVVSGSPVDGTIPAGVIITEINGTQFDYTDGYYDTPLSYVNAGELNTVSYVDSSGTKYSKDVVWGNYIVNTASDGPASDLKDTWMRSVVYKGTTYYFYTAQGFSKFMGITHPGDELTVNYSKMNGGTLDNTLSATYTLGTKGSIGYLGVYSTTSGMQIITPGTVKEMGANPLYGATDISSAANSLLQYISMPFQGFDPVPENLQWWYGDLGDLFWVVCQLLYWIFWLNLLLGITNALPAFPFDGGYVLLGWVDAIYERLGVKDPEERNRRAGELTNNVSTLFLFMFMLVIIVALI